MHIYINQLKIMIHWKSHFDSYDSNDAAKKSFTHLSNAKVKKSW